jgi:glycine/D-amino acid oxidase-like deaminating enzyme
LKVGIVGAGIMGLSAAWALRRRGHEVAVYERGPIPSPLASSNDQHRLIRYAYGAAHGYAAMVREAYAAWEDVFTDIGERLYEHTGTLVAATRTEAWARASAESLEALGHRVEWLEPGQLEERFPVLTAEELKLAFYADAGGVLMAREILEALARVTAAAGVTLHAGAEVADVDPARAGVRLADGSAVAADALVVAAGAWAPRLLPALTGRLTASRQVVVYLEPPQDLARFWRRAPMLLDIDADTGFYLVPPVRGTQLKIGDHRFSLEGDPDAPRIATAAETEALFALCARRLRAHRSYRIAGAGVCFYTVEPRERFVVEPVDRAWVLSACSGHGFKFGPVVGARLAEAMDGARRAADVVRWAAGE